MIRSLRIWLSVCGLVFLQACATPAGPTDAPDFKANVQKALPAQEGALRLADSGSWFPNVRGFNDVRQNGMLILLGEFPPHVQGVMAATDHSLMLLQWDEQAQRYDVIKRFAYLDQSEAFIETSGIVHRLVLRHKDYSYQSLAFHSMGENRALLEQVLTLAKAKIPKS